jgi:hypothetical protein
VAIYDATLATVRENERAAERRRWARAARRPKPCARAPSEPRWSRNWPKRGACPRGLARVQPRAQASARCRSRRSRQRVRPPRRSWRRRAVAHGPQPARSCARWTPRSHRGGREGAATTSPFRACGVLDYGFQGCDLLAERRGPRLDRFARASGASLTEATWPAARRRLRGGARLFRQDSRTRSRSRSGPRTKRPRSPTTRSAPPTFGSKPGPHVHAGAAAEEGAKARMSWWTRAPHSPRPAEPLTAYCYAIRRVDLDAAAPAISISKEASRNRPSVSRITQVAAMALLLLTTRAQWLRPGSRDRSPIARCPSVSSPSPWTGSAS